MKKDRESKKTRTITGALKAIANQGLGRND
jgi:hypothetical protein